MKKNSIAKNYVYNLIYQLLTIFLPLITTPYLSRVLGAEQIGIYGFTTSIVTYFILFGSLGLAMYGQREIAYVQNNKERRSKIFWEIVITRAIALVISGIIFYFIYARSGQYSFYYTILLIQLIANIFDVSFFFQGIEEFDKTVIRNLVVKLLCLVLIFTVVKEYNDLWKYFLIYAGAELIGNLSIWFYVPKYINKIKLKALEFKHHVKPALSLFLPQIAIQIYTVLDKTMIGIISTMTEVGYYEQAQKIVRAGVMVAGSLQTVMNSRIANAYAKHDDKEIKECLEKSFKFVWLFSIPLMFGMIGVAEGFVPWFYGQGFDGVTGIMIATSPILIAVGLNGITGIQYLVQVRKQNIFTKSVILGSIINIIFNLLLIPIYGGVGAAISSVIAETSIFIYQLKYFKKLFSFTQILKFGIKNILCGIVMLLSILIISKYLTISILSTLIELIIGMIIYFGLLYLSNNQFLKDIVDQTLRSLLLKRGDKNAKN